MAEVTVDVQTNDVELLIGENVFGTNYQHVAVDARSTTTSTTFQTKASLVTVGSPGTYLITWTCATDNANKPGEVRLQDTTTPATLCGPRIYSHSSTPDRRTQAGHAQVVLTGTALTIALQFRNQAGAFTQGIEFARISIWRVA